MIYFIGLYTAHLCGDVLAYFPVLSRAKREDRNNQKILAISIHCLIHTLFVFLWFRVLNLEPIVYAMVYIFVAHFIIDLSRGYFEDIFIGKEELLIIRKQDFIRWCMKKEESDVKHFMSKYFLKWISLNLADQGLHLLSVALFVYIVV